MLVVLLYRRAIAYPFNAKQPNDMTKRHLKVTPEMLEKLRARVDVSLLFFYTGTSKISAGNQVRNLRKFRREIPGKVDVQYIHKVCRFCKRRLLFKRINRPDYIS
jgi:hypothetical protein